MLEDVVQLQGFSNGKDQALGHQSACGGAAPFVTAEKLHCPTKRWTLGHPECSVQCGLQRSYPGHCRARAGISAKLDVNMTANSKHQGRNALFKSFADQEKTKMCQRNGAPTLN